MLGAKGLTAPEYAISANAILGIRDSGKTYTATKAAEELIDAGIPWIAFDPIGVWHSIRIPGKGKGYPVVVVGGRHADLPLDLKNISGIVRAAMEENVPLVIDLFSKELSKADWRRIVREAVEVLMHENPDHGLRHIFIEEAAEFVPQRPRDGLVYEAIERLVRMGGNSKLGCTLINQRSADINKSVLELCANVFVHRQTGKNTLIDLQKWFEMMGLDKAQRGQIEASIPNLDSGHCWLLSTELAAPVMLKIAAKNSQHPDRRAVNTPGAAPAKRQSVAADAFIAAMKERIAKKVERPKPASAAPAPAAKASSINQVLPEEVQRAVSNAFASGRATGVKEAYPRGYKDGFEAAKELVWDEVCNMSQRLSDEYRRKNFSMPKITIPNDFSAAVAPVAQAAKPLQALTSPARQPAISRQATGSGVLLSKSERAVLEALAHFPEGASKKKIAIISGYAVDGGGFNNALSRLRVEGWLNRGDPLCLTGPGRVAAGEPKPLPSGMDLFSFWVGHPKLGRAEREVLTALFNVKPAGIQRDELARTAGYEPGGGGFNNALSRLRVLNLIEGKGELRAADEFCVEG